MEFLKKIIDHPESPSGAFVFCGFDTTSHSRVSTTPAAKSQSYIHLGTIKRVYASVHPQIHPQIVLLVLTTKGCSRRIFGICMDTASEDKPGGRGVKS